MLTFYFKGLIVFAEFILNVYIAEYIVRETSEGRNVIGYIATEYEGIIMCCTCVYCVEKLHMCVVTLMLELKSQSF